MFDKQQGRANFAAHQAAHDAVAYRVMMDESAAHLSMPLNVSDEHSHASGRQAGVGDFYFRALSQLDGCSPSRFLPSPSPSTPRTPPTPSTPSGTWHSQVPKCEPTLVVHVYEYGKPPVYPGPAIYYCSIDNHCKKNVLSLNDKDFKVDFKVPTLHQPSPCNCVDCWDARER